MVDAADGARGGGDGVLVAAAAAAGRRGGRRVRRRRRVVDGRLRADGGVARARAGSARVRVLLPAGYDDPANAGRTWPILWLLHGVGDDQSSWTGEHRRRGPHRRPRRSSWPCRGRAQRHRRLVQRLGRRAGVGDVPPDRAAAPRRGALPRRGGPRSGGPSPGCRWAASAPMSLRRPAPRPLGGRARVVLRRRPPDVARGRPAPWPSSCSGRRRAHPATRSGARTRRSQATWHGHDPFDLAANLPLARRPVPPHRQRHPVPGRRHHVGAARGRRLPDEPHAARAPVGARHRPRLVRPGLRHPRVAPLGGRPGLPCCRR